MRVSTTTARADLERILRAENIDVFVLCHTLSPKEGDLCLVQAHALRPAMKTLVLTANTPLGPLGSRQVQVSAFDGPKVLLAAIKDLVEAKSIPPNV